MRKLLSALALAALLAAGCSNGDNSSASNDAMVIKITMLDNKYEPSEVTVPKGREVTFEFTNKGTVNHEALVGDEQAQMDHAQEMMSSTSADSGDIAPMASGWNQPTSTISADAGCASSGLTPSARAAR